MERTIPAAFRRNRIGGTGLVNRVRLVVILLDPNEITHTLTWSSLAAGPHPSLLRRLRTNELHLFFGPYFRR